MKAPTGSGKIAVSNICNEETQSNDFISNCQEATYLKLEIIKSRFFFVEYSINNMQGVCFPLRELRKALSETSTLKQHLSPFIKEVLAHNIQWIFYLCSELYHCLTSSQCQSIYRFNSLAALKILMDTCQFPVILIAEVYFLPFVSKIANYQLNAPEKTRGLDYFSPSANQRPENARKLGYNFVRLACEIVSMFAVIKPYKLCKNQEIADHSGFSVVLEHMKNQNWKQYDNLAFYSQNPVTLRSLYLQKLQGYFNKTKNYEKFVRQSLDNIIRKDLVPIGLDIRKTLEFYEGQTCLIAFEMIRQLSKEYEAVTLINIFKLTTDFVRWGNIRAFYLIENQGIFDNFFEMIINSSCSSLDSQRGKYVFYNIEGLDEDRINLYTEVLRSLQIWTVCIAKDLIDPSQESKVTLMYKKLKYDIKVEFPYVGNLKKIRNQSNQNFEKNKYYNHKQLNWPKKENISKGIMRRDSLQLTQLMSNTLSSKMMKAVFNQRKQAKSRFDSVWHSRREDEDSFNSNDLRTEAILDKQHSTRKQKLKATTFADAFFREKRSKKKIRLSDGPSIPLERDKLLFSDSSCKRFDTYGGNISLEFKQKEMNKFRKPANEDWTTDYSHEIEEEGSLFCLDKIKNSIVLKKPAFQQSHPTPSQGRFFENKDEELQQTVVIKQLSSSQSQGRSSTLRFFSESNQSCSSLQSKTIFRSSQTPYIKIQKPPEQKIKPYQVKISQLIDHDSSYYDEIISMRTPSIQQFYRLEERLSNLEVQKAELKQQLQGKQQEINMLRSHQQHRKMEKQQSNSTNFDWGKYLFSEEEIKETKREQDIINYSKQGIKICSIDNIKATTYNYELNQLKEVQGKKLLKNKDLLVRNDKIEIGFVFQFGRPYSQLTLYLTPQKDILNLKYQWKASSRITYIQSSQKINAIARNKQKKISYKISVQPPYSLPELLLTFQIDNKAHHLNLLLPISYNKFVQIHPPTPPLQTKIIRRQTNIGMLNKKIFKSCSQLLQFFSALSLKTKNKDEEQLYGSLAIDFKVAQIRMHLQNSDFIQMDYTLRQQDRQIYQKVEFYLLTLWTILTQ